MHSYRRLLVLLVIPFSLLSHADIQSMSIWDDNKAACIVGGVGLCGMVATYVLTKKYSNKKLIDEKVVLVERNGLMQAEKELASRTITELRERVEQHKQMQVAAENKTLLVQEALAGVRLQPTNQQKELDTKKLEIANLNSAKASLTKKDEELGDQWLKNDTLWRNQDNTNNDTIKQLRSDLKKIRTEQSDMIVKFNNYVNTALEGSILKCEHAMRCNEEQAARGGQEQVHVSGFEDAYGLMELAGKSNTMHVEDGRIVANFVGKGQQNSNSSSHSRDERSESENEEVFGDGSEGESEIYHGEIHAKKIQYHVYKYNKSG